MKVVFICIFILRFELTNAQVDSNILKLFCAKLNTIEDSIVAKNVNDIKWQLCGFLDSNCSFLENDSNNHILLNLISFNDYKITFYKKENNLMKYKVYDVEKYKNSNSRESIIFNFEIGNLGDLKFKITVLYTAESYMICQFESLDIDITKKNSKYLIYRKHNTK